MKKPWTKMTAAELAVATAEFDKPGAVETFRPLTPAQRSKWKKATAKQGRPRKPDAEKSVRVLISIHPALLAAAHRFAQESGETLSGLIAKQLASALPKKRRSA